MSETDAPILVIDDDPFARAFAEAVLVAAGYRVAQASTASDGIELARKLMPALVLLDYAMPGMTGIDVLRAIRSDTPNPDVPVIVLSAWASDSVRKAVEALGAVWLAKPLGAVSLSGAVGAALS